MGDSPNDALQKHKVSGQTHQGAGLVSKRNTNRKKNCGAGAPKPQNPNPEKNDSLHKSILLRISHHFLYIYLNFGLFYQTCRFILKYFRNRNLKLFGLYLSIWLTTKQYFLRFWTSRIKAVLGSFSDPSFVQKF